MNIVVPGTRFHDMQEVLASALAKIMVKMQLGKGLPKVRPALTEDGRKAGSRL